MKEKMAFSHDRSEDGKEEWLTPPSIVKKLGPFDLDPCSPVNRPWDTAKRHLTILEDGLNRPWSGRVWMNPPYGPKTGAWMQRLAEYGNGIALIFARTETQAWHQYIWPKASALLFLKGRLTFFNVDGTPGKNSAGAPSVLVSYGEENANILSAHCDMGAFIRMGLVAM